MNTPNLTPASSRREAFSLLFIFAILYAIVFGCHTLGHYLAANSALWVQCIGWGFMFISWLFAVAVTAVLVFSLYDWHLDRKACDKRGIEQTPMTSGVPFLPGVTTPLHKQS